MDRRGRWLALLGLLVLAGTLAAGTAAAAPPDDPGSDVLGWENGYWHNESIAVDQSDGLDDAEREAFVSRAMARVEVIREREFVQSVPVEVIPRSEYGNRTSGDANESYSGWNNQVWEALFVVGENQNVVDVLHSTSTSATSGAYFITDDEIKIITDTPEQPQIARGTLVHELVHAQQDQYVDLANETYQGTTQDEQLATNGLIEGEANFVEDRYEERCGAEWECVALPSSGSGSGGGGGSGGQTNVGVLVTLYHPYSDGPPYVHSLVEAGGWSAVEAKYDSPPNSTEQIIHHTEEAPVPLDVPSNARNGWEPFPGQGLNGTDTVGEASIFTMLWNQARASGAETIPSGKLFEASGPYDTYNYDSVPSAGWANDVIRPYRRTTDAGETEYGYEWTTAWDSEADATQFHAAYRAILTAHDARKVGPRTWVIDSGPYADAFRIVKEGRRVTIVNAPEVGDLANLRPDLPALSATPTTTAQERTTPNQRVDTPTSSPGAETTPPVEQPGFGVLAALSALVVAGLARRWWHGNRP